MEDYSDPEKAQCMFLFNETKSATVVQRRFRTEFGTFPSGCPQLPWQPLPWKMARPWWQCRMASKVTGLQHHWISHYGVLIRVSCTCLGCPNSAEEPTTRISPAILHADDEMLDRIQAELEYRWDMPCYKGGAYWGLMNQRKITLGCASLHLMSFTFILKLQPELLFYKSATEVCNYSVYNRTFVPSTFLA
jgi:hypothetical protein